MAGPTKVYQVVFAANGAATPDGRPCPGERNSWYGRHFPARYLADAYVAGLGRKRSPVTWWLKVLYTQQRQGRTVYVTRTLDTNRETP